MGSFLSIFLTLVGDVRQRWCRITHGSLISSLLIGDYFQGYRCLAFEQHLEESACCTFVSAALDKYVDHITILINGSPKILAFAADGQENLIQIPNITEFSLTLSKCPTVLLREFDTPTTNGLVRCLIPADRQHFFNITKAESEPMIEPNGMTDNLRWKAVTVTGIFRFVHGIIIISVGQRDKTTQIYRLN